jgi:hypothetical protein
MLRSCSHRGMASMGTRRANRSAHYHFRRSRFVHITFAHIINLYFPARKKLLEAG